MKSTVSGDKANVIDPTGGKLLSPFKKKKKMTRGSVLKWIKLFVRLEGRKIAAALLERAATMMGELFK